jgi:hypothetical protein
LRASPVQRERWRPQARLRTRVAATMPRCCATTVKQCGHSSTIGENAADFIGVHLLQRRSGIAALRPWRSPGGPRSCARGSNLSTARVGLPWTKSLPSPKNRETAAWIRPLRTGTVVPVGMWSPRISMRAVKFAPGCGADALQLTAVRRIMLGYHRLIHREWPPDLQRALDHRRDSIVSVPPPQPQRQRGVCGPR